MQAHGCRPSPCWRCGRALVWDATCPDTYASSHVTLAAREAGNVAIQAEQQKTEKYAHLTVSHHFMPFAFKTSSSSSSFYFRLVHKRTYIDSYILRAYRLNILGTI